MAGDKQPLSGITKKEEKALKQESKVRAKVFRRRSWGGGSAADADVAAANTLKKLESQHSNLADVDDDDDDDDEEDGGENDSKDKFGPGTGRDHRRRSLDYAHLDTYRTQWTSDADAAAEANIMAENYTKFEPVDLRHLDPTLPSSASSSGARRPYANISVQNSGQVSASQGRALFSDEEEDGDVRAMEAANATGNENAHPEEETAAQRDHRRRSLDYQHMEQYKDTWKVNDKIQPTIMESDDERVLNGPMNPPLVVEYVATDPMNPPLVIQRLEPMGSGSSNVPLVVERRNSMEEQETSPARMVGPGAKRISQRRSLDQNLLDSHKTRWDEELALGAAREAQSASSSLRPQSLDYSHLAAAKVRDATGVELDNIDGEQVGEAVADQNVSQQGGKQKKDGRLTMWLSKTFKSDGKNAAKAS